MEWQYILVDVCGCAGAAYLLRLIDLKTGDHLTFAHIFSVVWGACILACQIPPANRNPPELITIVVLIAGWWAFLTGALLVLQKPLPVKIPIYSVRRRPATIVLWTLVALHVFTWSLEAPPFAHAGITSVRDIAAFLSAIRVRHLYEVEIPWYLKFVRSGFVYYFPLALIMRRKGWLSRGVLALILCGGGLLTLVKFTRAPLLWATVVLYVSWMVLYRPGVKRCVLTAGLLVFAFTSLFFWMQTFVVDEGLVMQGTHTVLDGYFGGTMRAYESILRGEYPPSDGWYSLDMVNYVLKKLGFIFAYPELVRDYGTNPTNLYTFLDAYTLDFGIPGAVIGAFVTGAFAAFTYRRMRCSRRVSALTIYVTVTFFCVMSIANNEFIRNTLLMMTVFVVPLDFALAGRSADRYRREAPGIPGRVRLASVVGGSRS